MFICVCPHMGCVDTEDFFKSSLLWESSQATQMTGLKVLEDPGEQVSFGMGDILGIQASGKKGKARQANVPGNCNMDKKSPAAEF